ncbi:hypothetical protein [Streptococcus oriscaviae]|uniref:ESAT-6 secretion machinery protein EssA n=1 Tax=Streptococcus oriscaviae TaxID=2781599 RepID=A0ABX7YMZ8_9STRE|nr:hypothetical protein [Streptococcus oriscaviae]QUE55210.1 hypothetical protein INT76_04875 [Streptococcus oriscaviae]
MKKFGLLVLIILCSFASLSIGAEEGTLNINNNVIYDNIMKEKADVSSNPYLFLNQMNEQEKALQEEIIERHSKIKLSLFTESINNEEEAGRYTISSYLFTDNYQFSNVESGQLSEGTSAAEELGIWMTMATFFIVMLIVGIYLGRRFSKLLYMRRGE